MGRRASAALALVWKRRIVRQRRSRFSVVEFCRREGVSPKSFYVWRKRLRDPSRAARHEDPSRAARHEDSSRAALHVVPPRAALRGAALRGTKSGARRSSSRSGARRLSSGLFVPVELPAAAPVGVRIELPGGVVVILPADASARLLCAAMRAAVRAGSSRTVKESSSC